VIKRAAAAAALALVVLTPVAASQPARHAASNATAAGDWLSFGRTPDSNRDSPLTQITTANVDQLKRDYLVDFAKLDPDIKKGQQSYPLAIGGKLYLTTNDDNVFALDGATGKVLWQYKPPNSAVFKNFGIVANRGLAYCDNRLFITQLDMKIVALNPTNGKVVAETAMSQDIPNASSNYGYSETSAPVCANNRVLVGAAGSEYGVRGFVMAYTPDLKPAWPEPFWTVPPDLQSWRRASRVVGGGAVWTPVTVDTTTNTVYFGTGSATPLYFPALRPGNNPRTDGLIAVNLQNGKMRWWQQLISGNQWAYDVSQPPLVYTGQVGGKTHRIVSVATMEGVWFAFDAATGQPFHERVKVIDRIEHPPLKPGQPVTVFPSSLGGLNYSPAAYDPKTNYVFNAAAETASVLIQQKLTPTQKKRKLLLGDVYLGLSNGNFGTALQNWHDHGSISAIDVSSGKRVWKITTPEPERGGVTVTAGGVGFDGGGDGVFRAFNLKTGKVLWTFKAGAPIASGPTVFSAGGREYVAITVGGTPTSSNGGTASQLVVFSLGSSSSRRAPSSARGTWPVTSGPAAKRAAHARVAASGGARISVDAAPVALKLWQADSSNEATVGGHVFLGGRPVAGARVSVDRYVLPQPTGQNGGFQGVVDATLAQRHPIHVVDASHATVGGHALSAAQQRALRNASSGFSVGYRIVDARAKVQKNGTVLVTGRAVRADGVAAPPVVQLSYRLEGTITDASGKPVSGATVVTRTTDRDFWTFSLPSNAQGHYVSFFTASDEAGDSPVPLSVQVASGRTNYSAGPVATIDFKPDSSSRLDLKLPASGAGLALPTPSAEAGAFFRGLLIGVRSPAGVVKPLSGRWPDAQGRFSLVLPKLKQGTPLTFWENDSVVFSQSGAKPGGPVASNAWPAALTQRVTTGIDRIQVGR
jgi:PQQ-dependent dehydrogenase (methanol/ethanol family)